MSLPPREPSSASSDPRGERRTSQPTLFERLRSLLGLGGASIRDDIEDALEETDTSGVFTPQERAMLRNVLNLHEIRVEDVMVPRADMMAIGMDASLKEVLAAFRESGHSRLPVHGETLDDAKGMVHIRDFIDYITAPGHATHVEPGAAPSDVIHIDMAQTLEAAGVMRSVLFVPPSMQALDLLVRMQTTRTHMAIVIDEFGGTDGLVTIEDIVEVIVGDIEDEHDERELSKITAEADGTYVVDARALLEEVIDAVGPTVVTPEDEDEVDTIGGLVSSLAGRVPSVGELISGRGTIDFVVLEADPRRVKRVRLQPKPITMPEDVDTAGPGPLASAS